MTRTTSDNMSTVTTNRMCNNNKSLGVITVKLNIWRTNGYKIVKLNILPKLQLEFLVTQKEFRMVILTVVHNRLVICSASTAVAIPMLSKVITA